MRRILLALAATGLVATPALAEQGPPIPVAGPAVGIVGSAEQAALDAQAGVAAQAQFVRECATIYAGQCVPTALAPAAPDPLADALAAEVRQARGTPVVGGNRAREQQAGPTVGGLRLATSLPALLYGNVTSRVRLTPSAGVDYYSAIVRMNRIGPNGIPVAVGLPITIPTTSRPLVGDVGAVCVPRRWSARSFYVSVTAAVLMNTGRAFSGTRYSVSSQLPC